MKRWLVASPLVVVLLGPSAWALEPNESFAAATILPVGVRSVSDELTVEYVYPDTYLGIRSPLGEIVLVDDDNSILGDGFASGLNGVSIETDSIEFAVTGFGDGGFTGAHQESGQYEVFIDVFDSSSTLINSFSEVSTLAPGVVDEFDYSDPTWLGGTFNVNVNNINGHNDIDFFTFTGLDPGAAFAARTSHIESSTVDTVLGLFDDTGTLVTSDDDGGGEKLSLIEGIVPPSGSLTLAVTGFGDLDFQGYHSRTGAYGLDVTQVVETTIGDYNEDGVVDAADYTVWSDNVGGTTLANRDPGNTGVIGEDDFVSWKTHYGETAGSGSLAAGAVPEPSTVLLVGIALLSWMLTLRRCTSS